MNERFAKVEAMQRELSTVLGNAASGRVSLVIFNVSLYRSRVALELPHPGPTPLLATNGVLTSAAPHTMLAGRSYIEGATR